ncbi:MAG: ferredoxin, partial [Spirochaetes bacterium]
RDLVEFVGNTSIIGAKMAMLSKGALDTAYTISKNITYYDLITYPNYMDEFMSAKFLPHTDITKFPSIQKVVRKVR